MKARLENETGLPPLFYGHGLLILLSGEAFPNPLT